MKTLLLLAALFSSSAFACQTSDIQKYFTQMIKPEAVQDLCRAHGGTVARLTASGGTGVLSTDPETAVGQYVIQCANGDLLVGTILLDARTCFPKSAMTEPTVQIFP